VHRRRLAQLVVERIRIGAAGRGEEELVEDRVGVVIRGRA
jgi:hypothetical protein